jgi:hypothetical protein
VQPPCQRKMPDFIGFYDHLPNGAENLAGPMRADPAI